MIGVKSNAGSPLDRRCEIRRYDGDVAEEVGPLVGLRVCDSVLRIHSGWAVRESAIVSLHCRWRNENATLGDERSSHPRSGCLLRNGGNLNLVC